MKTIPHLRLLTEELRAHERSGHYQTGFEALSEYWTDFHEVPETAGLPEAEKAALLLRCGALAGFLGRLEKSQSAQENSKNLLTTARDIFVELGNEAGVVEAENGISLAYMRKGEFREAETWIESSFARELSTDHFARIQSFLVKSMILLETKQYQAAYDFYKSVEPFFQEFDDDYLNGCFAANFGMAAKCLGKFAEAMQMYSLARHFHQRSGNIVLLAVVENNLANLYRLEGRFDLAHQAIDRAIELHNDVGDISRLGFAFDTKALIFLDEGKLSKAKDAAERCILILKEMEFSEFLVESLLTKIKIQIAGKNLASAAITFGEAAEIVRNAQGADRLQSITEEFEVLVNEGMYVGLSRIFSEKIIPGEELELELSPDLARYSEFDAIWIRNRHFESLGLEMGSIALVVAAEVVSGDLVAVAEIGSEEVVCGYFEREDDFIILSDDESEPQIFREEGVEIIGRIVGYANPETRVDGRLKVEPIKRDSAP